MRTHHLRSLAPGTTDPSTPLHAEDLATSIPPTIDRAPIIVRDRPVSPEDCHFWQYPCTTEKQAFDNHQALPGGANIDAANRVVHAYLGLPWATYIDKRRFPREVLAYLRPRLMSLRSLAIANGYELALHTVCQQIYWRHLIHQFRDLGITDLHTSHCERSSNQERERCGFRIHSWPLIAPNIENPDRTMGLTIGKPTPERRYLASFIGAHMQHYRSDVRVQLLEATRRDGGSDLLFELVDEWHFNKIVYTDQVGSRPVRVSDTEQHDARTRRYNEVLSDSVFSLCPEGAGPNTLRIWESLATGAIPVIIADDWLPPTVPGSAVSLTDCCIFVPSSEIDGVFRRLRDIGPQRVAELQQRCIQAYPLFRDLTAF